MFQPIAPPALSKSAIFDRPMETLPSIFKIIVSLMFFSTSTPAMLPSRNKKNTRIIPLVYPPPLIL